MSRAVLITARCVSLCLLGELLSMWICCLTMLCNMIVEQLGACALPASSLKCLIERIAFGSVVGSFVWLVLSRGLYIAFILVEAVLDLAVSITL